MGSAVSRGSADERSLVCPVVRSVDGLRLTDRRCSRLRWSRRGRERSSLGDVARPGDRRRRLDRGGDRGDPRRGPPRGAVELRARTNPRSLAARDGVRARPGGAPGGRRCRGGLRLSSCPRHHVGSAPGRGSSHPSSGHSATDRGADPIRVYVARREFEDDPNVLHLAPQDEMSRPSERRRSFVGCVRALRVRVRSLRVTGDGRRQAPAPVTPPEALAAAVADAARQEQHHQDDQQHPCPHRHLVTSFVVAVGPCLPV